MSHIRDSSMSTESEFETLEGKYKRKVRTSPVEPDAGESRLKRLRSRNEENHEEEEIASSISKKPHSLPELLDCSSLKDHVSISDRFLLIARSLLCEQLLVINPGPSIDGPEIEYALLEVEFYLLSAGYHEDPFTHGVEEQGISGNWYFHKAPRRTVGPPDSISKKVIVDSPAGGYRGGTRKGLDLTMGNPHRVLSPHFPQANSSPEAGPRGGVLFRSMHRVDGNDVISGPSLLVDEILRASGGASNVLELVRTKMEGEKSAFPSIRTSSKEDVVQLYLRPRPKPLETPIYSSPRIGLDLSNPVTKASLTDPRAVFVQKPYRFFVHPDVLTANGRPQTFLGIFSSPSFDSLRCDEKLLEEVARITGMKLTALRKYSEYYREGRLKGKLEDFVGSAGKGVCSKPSAYLRMMGTLAAAKT